MRTSTRGRSVIALLTVLLLLLAACGGDDDDTTAGSASGSGSGSGSAPAEKSDPVKVDYVEVVRSPLYAAGYVGIEKGFFEEEGLDVNIQTANGGDKVTALLVSGEADIALVGPDTTVFVDANPEGDVRLKMFGLQVVSDGAFLISREPADDFSWDDVKGKTIIGFRPGSMPENVLETALEENGLKVGDDVEVRTDLSAPTNVSAFTSGQGDYLLWVEPTVSQLVAAGRAHVAAAMAKEIGPVPYTAYTATEKYISGNKDVIERWMRAIQKANDWIRDASSAEVASTIVSYFEDIDEKLLADAIDRYRDAGVWPEGEVGVPSEDDVKRLQDILVDRKVLDDGARLDYDEIVDSSFAK